jgi:predicted nucleic acid-binding protein
VQHRAFDLVLAATALEHGLTLATRNTKDYADIPALALY